MNKVKRISNGRISNVIQDENINQLNGSNIRPSVQNNPRSSATSSRTSKMKLFKTKEKEKHTPILNKISQLLLKQKDKEKSLISALTSEFGETQGVRKLKSIKLWQKFILMSQPFISIQQQQKQIMSQGIDQSYKKLDTPAPTMADFNNLNLRMRMKMQRFVIDPDGTFFKVWSLILMTMMLYTLLYIPFALCFRTAINPNTPMQQFTAVWWFEVVFEVLFMIDIIINFLIPYQDNDNELRFEYSNIAMKYVTEYFIVDLVGAFPTNLVSLTANENEIDIRLIKLLKFPRMQSLVKLTKVNKLFDVLKGIDQMKSQMEFFIQNAVVLKFLQQFIFIMLGGHLFACLFVLTTVGPGKQNSWIQVKGLLKPDEPIENLEDKYLQVWLYSLYWAFTTITTTGQGDITPDAEIDQLVVVIILSIVGVVVNSLLNSNLSTALSESENNQTILAKKVHKLFTWAHYNKMPNNQKIFVRDYMEYRSTRHNLDWIMEKGIFEELPDELKHEVSMNTFNGALRNIRFFSKRTLTFIVEQVCKLQPVKITEKHFLQKQKDNPEEVFFIQKGRLSLLTHEGVVFKTFITNSYYGDVEHITDMPGRLQGVFAEIETELLVMSKWDFLDIKKRYPLYWPDIEESAYMKHQYTCMKKYNALKEVYELMANKSLRKSNKEKLNYINILKCNFNYKLLMNSEYLDLALKQAAECLYDSTQLLLNHLLKIKALKIEGSSYVNLKDPKNNEQVKMDQDQDSMIKNIVELQGGNNDLKKKLNSAINDLKNVIEFKAKHSSNDKEVFKNAIKINDNIQPSYDLNPDEEASKKDQQSLDNSDKILYLLQLTDSLLKRDKIKDKQTVKMKIKNTKDAMIKINKDSINKN